MTSWRTILQDTDNAPEHVRLLEWTRAQDRCFVAGLRCGSRMCVHAACDSVRAGTTRLQKVGQFCKSCITPCMRRCNHAHGKPWTARFGGLGAGDRATLGLQRMSDSFRHVAQATDMFRLLLESGRARRTDVLLRVCVAGRCLGMCACSAAGCSVALSCTA